MQDVVRDAMHGRDACKPGARRSGSCSAAASESAVIWLQMKPFTCVAHFLRAVSRAVDSKCAACEHLT
jgi:hypothetical protein